MKKAVFQGAAEEGTQMAAPSGNFGTRVRPNRGLSTGMPRWVKGFGIIFIIVALLGVSI